jgi:outer membrane lipoprotein-sorting protein
MRPAEFVEKQIRKLQYKTSAETHENIFNNVIRAIDEKQKPGAAPDVRRIIMKTSITKIAVAAMIIAAILVGINLLGGSGTGKVYADIVEQLASARTMTYSILTSTPVESMPTLRSQMIFKEPGLMRTTTADGYTNVIDWTQNKGISILPTKREYIEFEASNLEHDPDNDSFVVIEKLRSLPYEADEVLGEKEIDGQVLQGFCVIKTDMITTVWINPESTQLVRVEIDYTTSPGMNTIMTDFQFNVELDDSLFSLIPPEDFTPVQVQADVSTVTEEDLIDYLLMWSTWTKDGTFPPTFNPIELPKITAEMITQGKFGEDESSVQDKQSEATKMYRGIMFVTQLPAESNWRYAGENVSFGDPATPIFWYKPVGFETYRVIYADLSVKDVMPDMLPQ